MIRCRPSLRFGGTILPYSTLCRWAQPNGSKKRGILESGGKPPIGNEVALMSASESSLSSIALRMALKIDLKRRGVLKGSLGVTNPMPSKSAFNSVT